MAQIHLFFNLEPVSPLKADQEAKGNRWRACDRVENAAGFVEAQVNQWPLTLLVAHLSGQTSQNVRMKEALSWTPSCLGDNTVGIKRSQYLGGCQNCCHSSAPAITHPSDAVLPSSSDSHLQFVQLPLVQSDAVFPVFPVCLACSLICFTLFL